MADILHDFPIFVPASRAYEAISTPAGLDRWWTARSAGEPRPGAEFQLWFGPEYDWRAQVTRIEPGRVFELEMTRASPDWLGTRVGFVLESAEGGTRVQFFHTGWPDTGEHFRTSSYCWAMYLRILQRYLEHGESVPYERRLAV